MGSNPTSPTIAFALFACTGSQAPPGPLAHDASPADAEVSSPPCAGPVRVQRFDVAADAPVEILVGEASTLLITVRCAGGELAVSQLRAPDGVDYVTPGWVEAGRSCPGCLARTGVRHDRVSLLVPSAWRDETPLDQPLPLGSGSWTLTVSRLSGACLPEVEVVERWGWPVAPVLHVTPVVTSQADAHAALAALSEAADLLADGGLTVEAGEIRVAPELSELPSVERAVGLETGRTGAGLEVRFVPSLTDALGASYAGASPTPAPLSGAAVYVSLAASDEPLARVVAHELCHALGLFHTTEPDQPSVHDPIDDTLLAAATNLMTPAARGTALSPGQRAVLYGHPSLESRCPESPD